MKRSFVMHLSLCALSCGVSLAQPPGGRDGRPPGGRDGRPPRDGAARDVGPRERGPRDGGPRNDGPRDGGPRDGGPRDGGPRDGGPPHHPLMEVLDPDHDHVISAEEIKSAITALLKLDKNGDGKLTEDEFRPSHPGQGFGPPPPHEGEVGPGRPPRATGDRPRVDAPREAGTRDDVPREVGPPDSAPRERREGPPRGEGFGPPGGAPEGRGPGGPPGPGGFGRPAGPPSPAQFIEHVMEFDANRDGLLSKDELMQFAEQGMRRGGPGGGRPGGNRDDQPRPVRPTRPD